MAIEKVYDYILEIDRRHRETGKLLQECRAAVQSALTPRMTFNRLRDLVIVRERQYAFSPQAFEIILRIEARGGRMDFVDLIDTLWPEARNVSLNILERRLRTALCRARHAMEEIDFPFFISNDEGLVVLCEARPFCNVAVV